MSLFFSLVLLALVAVSMLLISLSLRLLNKMPDSGGTYQTMARFFLIAMRVAIGWHCLVEGMEKLNTPNWTSEAYLRESMGPASGVFRWIAGDRLIDRATVGQKDTFPPQLDQEWRDYFNAFAKYYELDADQLKRAQGILDQRKADTLAYLKSKSETITKIAPFPPDLKLEMTMKQRLDEHERLLQRVRAAEAKFPSSDKDVHAEWKAAKADLAKWRAEIKKSIDAQTAKLKRIDDGVKTQVSKNIDALQTKLKNAKDASEKSKLKQELDEEQGKLWEPLADVLTSDQKLKGPMPEPQSIPLGSWCVLEFSDFLVKWSLVVLGACLMLGLFSRATAFMTGMLLLSFFAAMPPLPGWPESPRLEGHYMLVNKTLIEVIALFALTFIPTGKWAGIDALLCAIFGKAPPKPPEPAPAA